MLINPVKTKEYKSIIFDCDGVILNSNHIKTEAFRKIASLYGKEAANSLVEYHLANGGVSRYAKFEYFVDSILPIHKPDAITENRSGFLRGLLVEFASEVKTRLFQCEVASGLTELRQAMPGLWMIVSGGDQAELRELFEQRGLAHYFDGGIYGSPKDKFSIVADLLKIGQIQHPTLFLGDSRLDHEVAQSFGLDFLFVSEWTEFDDWPFYCKSNWVQVVSSIDDILSP